MDNRTIDEVRRSEDRLIDKIELLEKENQELKKQIVYLRNSEYLNQLKFERDMLQDVVYKMKVSKEDKEFIDMTHRNTELLEEKQELIDYLKEEINETKESWGNCVYYNNEKGMFEAQIEIRLLEKILSKIEKR